MTSLRFTEQPLSEWMSQGGNESEIVMSTRVRIARNLIHHPFPMLSTNQQSEEILHLMEDVLADADLKQFGNLIPISMSQLEELDKQILVEKHLISPNLANESRNGAAFISEDESLSIMVNEEDHLRIQCLYPGLQVQEAWEKAAQVDDIFEKHVDYAFDSNRGFLTSCPTNVGTGLRASVMMHLPALVLTQQINLILSAVSQVGLTVRGIYGEGSDAVGNLFQISNQITLGQSEAEIIENLYGVVLQIIDHEKNAREKLLHDSRLRMTDRVMRSYGILSHAAIIDSKEAAQRLSDVRLGVDIGLIESLPAQVINELNVMTQPGYLQKQFGENLSPGERDMYRAKLIRDKVGN